MSLFFTIELFLKGSTLQPFLAEKAPEHVDQVLEHHDVLICLNIESQNPLKLIEESIASNLLKLPRNLLCTLHKAKLGISGMTCVI